MKTLRNYQQLFLKLLHHCLRHECTDGCCKSGWIILQLHAAEWDNSHIKIVVLKKSVDTYSELCCPVCLDINCMVSIEHPKLTPFKTRLLNPASALCVYWKCFIFDRTLHYKNSTRKPSQCTKSVTSFLLHIFYTFPLRPTIFGENIPVQ